MYNWRKMTAGMRENVLAYRKLQSLPWHSPPYRFCKVNSCYLLTAACYEHAPIIGPPSVRMIALERALLATCEEMNVEIFAWCVLPNHSRILVSTDRIRALVKAVGQTHGRFSFQWNGEDQCRGRKVWCGCTETYIKSASHFWATMNYIHHNPVKHGYCENWTDWPCSSAESYLSGVGRARAIEIWSRYPIESYGNEWDPSTA
jgi:putative transposase